MALQSDSPTQVDSELRFQNSSLGDGVREARSRGCCSALGLSCGHYPDSIAGGRGRPKLGLVASSPHSPTTRRECASVDGILVLSRYMSAFKVFYLFLFFVFWTHLEVLKP